jgi:hypothetical protein
MTQDLSSEPGAAAASAGPDTVRAFVNERGVSVARGATALDAVRAFDAALADALAAGTQRLTDSRGLPIASTAVVHGGAIYRLLPVRATAADLAADLAEGAA